MFLNNYRYIILNYTLDYNIKIFGIIYFSIFYYAYAISKLDTIFNITFSLVLFATASATAVFSAVIVPFTSMYVSL